MTKTVPFLLLLFAPSIAWAQAAGPGAPLDALSLAQAMTASGDAPLSCQGNNQAFALEAERLIAERINSERARLAPDAPPLRPDPGLSQIARFRSCEMTHGQPFSHTDAQGRFVAGDLVRQIFGPEGAVGENIMKMGGEPMEMIGVKPFGPEEFTKAAVDGWMKSPEHRANVLNVRFDSSGIGVAMVDGEAVATEIFHGPVPKGGGGAQW